MNNKKTVIIILVLFIIFFSWYFLIKNNDNLFNTTVNDSIISDNISKNISSNSINSSTNINDNSNNNYYSNIDNTSTNQGSNSMKQYNYQNTKKSKEKTNEITAEDILKRVKREVYWEDSQGRSTQDVRLGKPYKFDDMWLVGAFDKKSGKFLGAIWVPSEGGYINGPDKYSEYKDIISGKSNYKSDSSRIDHKVNSKLVEEEFPDYSERYVLATVNPEVDYYPISDYPLDLPVEPVSGVDLNQQIPTEYNNETA